MVSHVLRRIRRARRSLIAQRQGCTHRGIGRAFEPLERRNLLAGNLEIADLEVTSLSETRIGFEFTLLNSGDEAIDLGGPLPGNLDNIRLRAALSSTDQRPGATSSSVLTTALGPEPLPVLEPGESYMGQLSLGAPINPEENDWLALEIDISNAVDEEDETDNYTAIQFDWVEFVWDTPSQIVVPGAEVQIDLRVNQPFGGISGAQLNFSNSSPELTLAAWETNPVFNGGSNTSIEDDGIVIISSTETQPSGTSLGTLTLVAPDQPGDYVLDLRAAEDSPIQTVLLDSEGTLWIGDYAAATDDSLDGQQVLTLHVSEDTTAPTGEMTSPEATSSCAPSHVEIMWSDPGENAVGVDPASLEPNNIVVRNAFGDVQTIATASISETESSHWQYHFASPLADGEYTVEYAGVENPVHDYLGNEVTGDAFTFEVENDSPSASALPLNKYMHDPPEPGLPAIWQNQRSDIRQVSIPLDTFDILTVEQLSLVNLGIAIDDPDVEIPLTESQLTATGNNSPDSGGGSDEWTLNFERNDLSDGIYELRYAAHNECDTLHWRFSRFLGDFRGFGAGPTVGDGRVSVPDFAPVAFWWGSSTSSTPGPGEAPLFVDMDGDGGLSIFDFPWFSERFGQGVEQVSQARALPPGASDTDAAVFPTQRAEASIDTGRLVEDITSHQQATITRHAPLDLTVINRSTPEPTGMRSPELVDEFFNEILEP